MASPSAAMPTFCMNELGVRFADASSGLNASTQVGASP